MMMMIKQLFPFIALFQLTSILLPCTTILAKTHHPHAPSPSPLSQSLPPPTSLVDAPPPSSPPDIIAILKKSGGFSAFIRLLRTTQVDDRITTLLSDSSQGLTLFAPNDEAFSRLRSGVLNSLSDRDQVQLVLFHMLSAYFPIAQFQTSSNPLHTEAGDNANGDFPLNITTADGGGSDGIGLNLTTGIDSAVVTKTVYSDGQMAVYEVDKVLLPAQIFRSLPSAFAAPKRQEAAAGEDETASVVSSGCARGGGYSVTFSVALALLLRGIHQYAHFF